MQHAKREFAAFARVPITTTQTVVTQPVDGDEEGMWHNRCLCVSFTVVLVAAGAVVGVWYALERVW